MLRASRAEATVASQLASSQSAPRSDTDKQRARNERALAVATGHAEELTKELAASKTTLQELRDQLAEARAAVTARDRSLQAMSAQLQEATIGAVRLQMQVDADREHFDQVRALRETLLDRPGGASVGDGTEDSVAQRLAAEVEQLKSALEASNEEQQQLRGALAEAGRAAQRATMGHRSLLPTAPLEAANDDAAYAELLQQLRATEQQRDEARRAQDELTIAVAKLRAVQAAGKAKGAGGQDTADASMRGHVADRLWEAQQQVSHVRALATQATQEKAEKEQHFRYAKDVLLKCLTAPDSVRGQLAGVVSTVFGYNPSEVASIHRANPTWATRPAR